MPVNRRSHHTNLSHPRLRSRPCKAPIHLLRPHNPQGIARPKPPPSRRPQPDGKPQLPRLQPSHAPNLPWFHQDHLRRTTGQVQQRLRRLRNRHARGYRRQLHADHIGHTAPAVSDGHGNQPQLPQHPQPAPARLLRGRPRHLPQPPPARHHRCRRTAYSCWVKDSAIYLRHAVRIPDVGPGESR